MDHVDALIVGAGPAGSTCARHLHRAGWKVAVMDRARFPRDKVCAGWVTPGTFRLLELDPAEYRETGLTMQEIRGFKTSILGAPDVETRYRHIVSYAIRRVEFDNYLLRRSGACVMEGTALGLLERRGERWIANGTIDAPLVIGAGGHFCPVARHLREEAAAGSAARHPAYIRPVVAREAEFHIEDEAESTVSGELPELFFSDDLEGYGWCVRKGQYLNIGLGRRDHGDLNPHVTDFMAFIERHGLARRASLVRWKGHAYLASGTGARPITGDGVLVIGDAAGLAYPESGEGIKPAVESGRLAAEALIAAGRQAPADALAAYERELRRRYPPRRQWPAALTGITRALGRRLLRSPAFTRRVVIEKWFLREQ